MITIVNYGLGNINAFQSVYKILNIPYRIASTKEDLVDSEKLILPGVGSFDFAMKKLNTSGMRDTIDDLVLNQHVPILGICVGMQMLVESSGEGIEKGLNWVPGSVEKFKAAHGSSMRIPHMGWNMVDTIDENPLFAGLHDRSMFYFLHSYYFEPESDKYVIGTSQYYHEFACAVNKENIYGVQFRDHIDLNQ